MWGIRSKAISAVLAGGMIYFPNLVSSSELDTGLFSVSIFPDIPSAASPVTLLLSYGGCDDFFLRSLRIDVENASVDISLLYSPMDFICRAPQQLQIPLGTLGVAGQYQVSFYQGNSEGELFSPMDLVGDFIMAVSATNPAFWPETPGEGSIQSGIGLIRGWACDANEVEVQFDEMPRIKVAYGTSRTDTNTACGDDNNGYGAVYAWGTLGHGAHIMKTYIDGVEVSRVEFEVAGLQEPFIRGLSGMYELENFPVPGESVLVRWSEAEQNFIIVEHTK